MVKNVTTNFAVTKIYDSLLDNSCCLLLDLSKIFDSVDRKNVSENLTTAWSSKKKKSLKQFVHKN